MTARGITGPGPGLTWLAERSGCTPDDLLADPGRLAAALRHAGHDVADLVARLGSDDATARTAAEAEAERLRQAFTDAPDPTSRLRPRAATALRDAAAEVRAATAARGAQDGTGTPPARPESAGVAQGPGVRRSPAAASRPTPGT